MKRYLEVNVVGVTFANRQAVIRDLDSKDVLYLKGDDGIQGHPHAVRVACGNLCVGFISDKEPDSLARRVRPFLDSVRIKSWDKVGGGEYNWGIRMVLEWDDNFKKKGKTSADKDVVVTLDNEWLKTVDNGVTAVKDAAPKVVSFIGGKWGEFGDWYRKKYLDKEVEKV